MRNSLDYSSSTTEPKDSVRREGTWSDTHVEKLSAVALLTGHTWEEGQVHRLSRTTKGGLPNGGEDGKRGRTP